MTLKSAQCIAWFILIDIGSVKSIVGMLSFRALALKISVSMSVLLIY